MANRLTNQGWTIQEILDISIKSYSTLVDNKKKRMKLDIKGGRMTLKNNLKWNSKEKKWEQSGRDVKIIFKIKSEPISYNKTDTLKNHYYPIYVLIHNWDLQFNSTFRWRTGSFFKWKSPKKRVSDGKTPEEKEKIRKKNQQIINSNIKKGLHGDFIFSLMFVLRKENILYGPLTCKNIPPKIKNPAHIPFFDKEMLYIVLKLLPMLFTNEKVNKFIKQERDDF